MRPPSLSMTRPLPSHVSMPLLLKTARSGCTVRGGCLDPHLPAPQQTSLFSPLTMAAISTMEDQQANQYNQATHLSQPMCPTTKPTRAYVPTSASVEAPTGFRRHYLCCDESHRYMATNYLPNHNHKTKTTDGNNVQQCPSQHTASQTASQLVPSGSYHTRHVQASKRVK